MRRVHSVPSRVAVDVRHMICARSVSSSSDDELFVGGDARRLTRVPLRTNCFRGPSPPAAAAAAIAVVVVVERSSTGVSDLTFDFVT